MEQKKEWIEDFWRTGYAIRLGKDQYFQEIRNKRIVTAKIWKAAFFQSLREAEIFAQNIFGIREWIRRFATVLGYWYLLKVKKNRSCFGMESSLSRNLGRQNFFPVRRKCRLM